MKPKACLDRSLRQPMPKRKRRHGRLPRGPKGLKAGARHEVTCDGEPWFLVTGYEQSDGGRREPKAQGMSTEEQSTP